MSCTPRLLPYLLAPVFGLFSALFGCRGDLANGTDPVASLRAPTASRRYDVAFWAERQHRRDPVWRAAWSFCHGRPEARFPNCASIRLVGWIEAPPPAPAASLPSFLTPGLTSGLEGLP